MSFQKIGYQPQVIRFLQRALVTGQIAHAYCFYGPAGTGKKKMALELAKAINCEHQTADACDDCPTCRQIEHGNHPDIVILQPDGSFIKIDQLRALQEQFQYRAATGIMRVVIIEQAEKMRPEAANSLLKFLEEPVSPMVAILLTEQIQAILPTVLSRCQKVRFLELHPNIRLEKLKEQGVPPHLARILAHIPSELPEEGEDRLSPKVVEDWCQRLITWNGDILTKGSMALLEIQYEWLQTAMEENQLSLILDLLLLWLRELLYYQLGQKAFLFPDWEQECRKQAFIWEQPRLLHAMETVMYARSQLTKFVQPQAILEQMVLKIQEGP
ncbi:DNA polymerase III subunit delta' [Thermoflavimicrobium dichotomicum]|uniref:DNA polymerase-3 subunit delta n=1 Tax=Thermoflavimicrobium dichotomicum TaxID=46223 RepID=A0A1I3JMB6_9BACL|nr:DNA polymerase III subunit delta' [Thermoflavimicrobium dichotomicum]SFI61045.1 DNA polymerase-3 subunit delta' [Thermoflavimicrobium dichotomicum]